MSAQQTKLTKIINTCLFAWCRSLVSFTTCWSSFLSPRFPYHKECQSGEQTWWQCWDRGAALVCRNQNVTSRRSMICIQCSNLTAKNANATTLSFKHTSQCTPSAIVELSCRHRNRSIQLYTPWAMMAAELNKIKQNRNQHTCWEFLIKQPIN